MSQGRKKEEGRKEEKLGRREESKGKKRGKERGGK